MAMSNDGRKEVISTLLKLKRYSFLSATARDKVYKSIVEVYPFFKYIAVCEGTITLMDNHVLHNISANDNWFWLPTNAHRVNELRYDIEQILEFNGSDKSYSHILSRVASGDAYGIVMPVHRYSKEMVKVSDIANAIEFFEAYDLKIKSLEKEHGYKLVYCWKNKKPYADFEAWVDCERLYGDPLSYTEYRVCSMVFYGDPKEVLSSYGTQEYIDTVTEMILAKNDFCKTKRKIISDAYVEQVKECYRLGCEIENANEAYEGLCALWETGEGAPKDLTDFNKKALKNAIDNLPFTFLDEILKYRRSGGAT